MHSAPLSLALALAFIACGANKKPAEEPFATTTTTGVGAPSAAPAEPMEGDCPSGGSLASTTGLVDCIRHCRGRDEAVPLGSQCASQRAACEAECRSRF